jgi:hypothetical protein
MWPCPLWTGWSCSSSCVPPPACRSCQRSFCRQGSTARPWRRRTAWGAAYLAKPFMEEILYAAIEAALANGYQGLQAAVEAATPTDRVVPSRACQRFARSPVSRSPAVHHSSIADRTNHLRCREAGRSVALFLEGAAPL